MTSAAGPPTTESDVLTVVENFLKTNAPRGLSEREFLGRRFDAGLAWIHFPIGSGGLGAPRSLQGLVESMLSGAGAEPADNMRNPVGLGMGAPTVVHHAPEDLRRRVLRPLWTAEEIWCQLFSEPGAGSDLANVSTKAVRDGDDWIVNGQKVWTSLAHLSRWAMLLARTDPAQPKHQGLTYFILDMHTPGVEVKPLRQATGEADFNEVFLTDVRIPDAMRISAVGDGWAVARTTLMNERTAIGGKPAPREEGHVGRLTSLWRSRPDVRTPGSHIELMRIWVEVEVARLTNERSRQLAAMREPGLEGSGAKVTMARNNQQVTKLLARLSPQDALRYDAWSMGSAPEHPRDRPETFHYLRARPNSIEGGTTEILLGQIADRVLNLPREPKIDLALAWQDIPK
ncbi:acyl-CoA dehydrogenase family protein [Tomitella biformata]|uniref:acyl-CoA dehydrogenase family protein n=1 Tax=Tomitella biformata TaxID=630403 RepID=UPI0004644B2A|nr:acyl-CoA dehydrogenase family protein [Tomitella biformata]